MLKKLINFIKSNLLIILAIIYLIWPLDIIPEVFVVAGGPLVLLDDGGILFIAIVQKLYTIWRDRNKSTDDSQQDTDNSQQSIYKSN
jgi:uncharacterized membrane protein YkvA (DUF1232 family)